MNQLPTHITIGIIGGGQLGKMLIEANLAWNIRYHVLSDDEDCPAAHLAHKIIVGSLLDEEKIRQLAAEVDILTYEIEHVHAPVLLALEKEGKEVVPSPAALQIIQNKHLQKNFYVEHHIATLPYAFIAEKSDWEDGIAKIDGDMLVIKSSTGGYDGKGVTICKRQEIIDKKYPFKTACIVEQYLPNAKEIAIMVACDRLGNTKLFPAVEMFFNPHSNLVEFLFSPTNFSKEIITKAENIAIQVATAFNSPGLFAVELFIDTQNNIWVNETAPRPHNSAHHSIEACYTSQFEQLNRILLGLPLGATDLIKHGAMINLTGPLNFEGPYQLLNIEKILAVSNVYVHLYNKAISKPNRKLGHITLLANNMDELIAKAELIKSYIKITSRNE